MQDKQEKGCLPAESPGISRTCPLNKGEQEAILEKNERTVGLTPHGQNLAYRADRHFAIKRTHRLVLA